MQQRTLVDADSGHTWMSREHAVVGVLGRCWMQPGAKIFNLGWQKTGTTSMYKMLGALGYRSLHNWPPERYDLLYKILKISPAGQIDMVNTSPHKKEFDDLMNTYDAFSDVPFCMDAVWPALVAHYPESRFVLVERDPNEWAASLLRMVTRALLVAPFRPEVLLFSDGTPPRAPKEHSSCRDRCHSPIAIYEAFVHGALYNVSSLQQMHRMLLTGDAALFKRSFIEHSNKVRAFFSKLAPNRYLTLKTAELSRGFERLGRFLDCSHPMNASKLKGMHANRLGRSLM
mmetsp:Transcript_76467/g.127401  ORF Transcript_76467/g.127401 Transcript_76467/m.127401 type:complete len:286 (+) Transcript_76467:136-993(+)